jgi:pimeloyl-ACP methyl ester carboxylesterase
MWSPIERHGEQLSGVLRKLDAEIDGGRVHLVTHSMGGIIGRLALGDYMPDRFGRFVMITPPNRGSHIASQLAPYFGRICPPLMQLCDDDQSFVCSLPAPQVPELGVIAASADFLVHEKSTRLGCEADHIVLPGLHSSLLWSRATAEQVRHFLLHGRFERAAEAAAVASCPCT